MFLQSRLAFPIVIKGALKMISCMKRLMIRLGLIVMFTLFLLVLPVGEARAYFDPGTGSYLVQLAAAGLLGAAFAIKIFWRKIKAALLKLFGRK